MSHDDSHLTDLIAAYTLSYGLMFFSYLTHPSSPVSNGDVFLGAHHADKQAGF